MYSKRLIKILAISYFSRTHLTGCFWKMLIMLKWSYFPINTLFRPKIQGYFYISQIIRIVIASFLQSKFRAFCYAGYKQFIWWIHHCLGKNYRQVIPSCALWKIRGSFPEESGNFVPFCEGVKNYTIINARLYFFLKVFLQ